MPDLSVLTAIAATLALTAAAGVLATGGWPAGLIAAAAFLVSPLLWSAPPPASALYPLPFVSAWLLASGMLAQRRTILWAALAGASLGLGLYASPASVVMMPAYVVITIVVLAPSRVVTMRQWMVFAATFALAAAPLLVRWVTEPALYRQLILSHHLYDANRFSVLQGVREVTSWVGLTARSEVFWDYLNPAFLFVTGRVLSWPLLVLVPLGMYSIVARDTSLIGRIVLAAFLIAPLAASLPAEPPVRARIAWILPGASLLAVYGVEFVRQLGRRSRH